MIDANNRSIKPKIMLHIIMPNQISGPNTSAKIISESYLSSNYEFCFLVQHKHAGGKISVKLIIDLYHQIEKCNPDIIHLSGLQSSGFHAMVAAKFAKHKSVIICVRGFSGDAINLSKMKRYAFSTIIEPFTLYFADAVYTVCNYAARRKMIQKYARNFFGYIHNSAPIVNHKSSKFSIKDELGIDDDEIIVTSASRIVEDKGYKYLSEAMDSILENTSKIHFVIAGDGDYKELLANKYMNEKYRNNVHLLGRRDDVTEILKYSDIFVLPTLHENLSNSLLEACATKNAIITTKVGGNPEVIKNEVNGLLVTPKNSLEIENAIMRYVNNKEFRIEMGMSALKTAEEEFSQKVNLNKVEKIYKHLINN